MVRRYGMGLRGVERLLTMINIPDGDYVRYSDYAKLEEALRECVEKIEKDCIDYCYGGPDHSKKCAEEECEWAEIIKKAREVLGDD